MVVNITILRYYNCIKHAIQHKIIEILNRLIDLQGFFNKIVVKNHPNADALNRLIYEFVAAIEKKELELWQQGKRISLELLKDALATRENNSSFISFFKQEVSNSSLKDSTKRNHLSTLLLLQEFKRDIVFSDLTFEFVSSFEYFLQQKGYHTNTIAKHMKHLKRHINIAINKEYIEIQKYACPSGSNVPIVPVLLVLNGCVCFPRFLFYTS